MNEGTLTVPRPSHRCQLPTVTRKFTLPADDDDPALETTYEDIPDLGSLYKCPCGQAWEVVPPKLYSNLVICVNQWKQISNRRYRRRLPKVRF